MISLRLVAPAVAVAFTACQNPKPTPTPPTTGATNLCEPAEFTTEITIGQINGPANSALLVGEHEIMMQLSAIECPPFAELAQLAAPCAQGPCGTPMSVAQMNDLQASLAGVQPIPVWIGDQAGRAFVLDDGAYIGWPRDVPPEPVITGAGNPVPEPASSGIDCCLGCGRCLPSQCGSNPPPPPPPTRTRYLVAASEQCDCDAVKTQYCAGGGEPSTEPGACVCADECCPPPPSS